jgi:hypothetical protein
MGGRRAPAGAAFRHCSTGSVDIACDQPHLLEYVNAWLPQTTGGTAPPGCAKFVRQYLGGPENRVGASVGWLPVPSHDGHIAACVVVSPGTRSSTGSLAGEAHR